MMSEKTRHVDIVPTCFARIGFNFRKFVGTNLGDLPQALIDWEVELSRLIALALAILSATPAAAAPLVGEGRAIDGDSLMVGTTEVRLFGIDAPELHQSCTRNEAPWSCGSAAADQLSNMVLNKQIECSTMGKDVHGRTLASCRVGSLDLNRYMVATGFAVAYRRYSSNYVSAEESAHASKRGIWAGEFVLPSAFRAEGDDYRVERSAPETSERPIVSSARSRSQPSGGCAIKGNHSRRGELIYHLPGMPYYNETKAEEMFCSEAQARAAGYRRSRADQHR